LRLALATLAVALLAPAPQAFAAACRFDPAAHALLVSVGAENASLVQAGGQLQLRDVTGQRPCLDAEEAVAATVTTTDAVHIVSDGNVTIDPSSGPFAPGFTPELTGRSEIEIDVTFTTPDLLLTVIGTAAADRLSLGTLGLDLDGDDDVDVRALGDAPTWDLAGLGGNDQLSSQGADGTGDPLVTPVILLGGDGDDLLTGSRSDDLLEGGAGSDQLDGRAGKDLLYAEDTSTVFGSGIGVVDVLDGGHGDDQLFGGPGNDVLFGADGDDVIRSLNGSVDRVIGGSGSDTSQSDPFDLVTQVENRQ
jgi:Ca2+-binding RTX toxin-like protein